nr:tyrosine-protein phosphatase Lar-like [Penaeus vannamei]
MMRERDAMSASDSAASSSAAGGGEAGDASVVGAAEDKKGRKAAPNSSRNNEQAQKSKKFLGSSGTFAVIPHRIQLSMLNSGLITITDEEKAIGAIPTKPINSGDLEKICAEHRKYPILYKVEFQMATKVECHSMRHALKESNELKNQNKRVLPYDYNRVVLEPLPDSPDSDYINASYVDSLLTPKAYVATQGPLENTIADFWRMAWQEKTRLIVMLTKTFDFIKVMWRAVLAGDGWLLRPLRGDQGGAAEGGAAGQLPDPHHQAHRRWPYDSWLKRFSPIQAFLSPFFLTYWPPLYCGDETSFGTPNAINFENGC